MSNLIVSLRNATSGKFLMNLAADRIEMLEGLVSDRTVTGDVRSNKFVSAAYLFAAAAHGDQVRKYTGEPYISHPVAVAEIVSQYNRDPEVLAAALLHDVVEDCGVTIPQLEAAFSVRTASLVYYVTEISNKADGNRAVRKQMDAVHYASGPWEAQLIKIADLIHNTESIAEHDAKFYRTYENEKLNMLQLMHGAPSAIVDRAYNQLEELRENLV